MVDWKGKAKALAALHTKQGVGVSVVPLRLEFTPTHLEMIESPSIVGTVAGKRLTPKQVRKFMYEVRDQPEMSDKEGAVYSVYDPEHDESVVGVGIMRSAASDS